MTGGMLTAAELADELSVSRGTLANWRSRGGGPRFTKVGANVRYSRADVDKWLETRRYSRTVPR